MLIFIFSSILAFGVSFLLIFLHAERRENGRAILISFRSSKLILSRNALFFIVALVIVCLMALTYYVSLLQIIEPTNGLYSVYDIVTGSFIDRLGLGLVFGFMSAVWLNRIYGKEGNKTPIRKTHLSPPEPTKKKRVTETRTDKDGKVFEKVVEVFENATGSPKTPTLSFVEKLEGVVLLVVFILGTTPYSIKDLISGIQVDSSVVKFQLHNQSEANLERDKRTYDIEKIPGNSEYHRSFNAFYLASVDIMAKRDHDYVKMHLNCTKRSVKTNQLVNQAQCADLEALEQVHTSIAPLMEYALCLAASGFTDGEKSFFRQKIRELIPYAAQIHIHNKPGTVAKLTKAYATFREIAYQTTDDLLSHSTLSDDAGKLCSKLRKTMKVEAPVIQETVEAGKESIPEDFLVYSFTERTAQRPYFSILYATLLALDQQYSIAIGTLEDWLFNFRKINEDLDFKVDTLPFWMEFRALSIQAAIYDAWAGDPKAGSYSSVSLEENIKQLGAYLVRFEQIPVIKNRSDYTQPHKYDNLPKQTLMGISFERLPDALKCTSDFFKKDDSRLLLFAAYRSASTIFAFRGIRHPEYKDVLAQKIDGILAELVNASPGCLKKFYDEEQRGRGYEEAIGEILRVYGMAQIQKIRFKRQVGDDYQSWLRGKLEVAIRAFRLAASQIAATAIVEKSARLNTHTHERFNIGHAEWLQRDLRARIDSLENVLDKRE